MHIEIHGLDMLQEIRLNIEDVRIREASSRNSSMIVKKLNRGLK